MVKRKAIVKINWIVDCKNLITGIYSGVSPKCWYVFYEVDYTSNSNRLTSLIDSLAESILNSLTARLATLSS